MATIENGPRLYLTEEQCEALGITKSLRAGTEATISGKVIVVSSTESVERDGDGGGPDVSLCVQVSELRMTPGKVLKNAADILYPEMPGWSDSSY